MKHHLIRAFLAGLIGWVSLGYAQNHDTLSSVSLLTLGDVNLGRAVGQKILKGDIDYPFAHFTDVLSRADIIFANLECPVTDQHGETQDPKSNLIFCAPPEAARSLRRAGITVVSTANNHAFDYGLKGLKETIAFLAKDSVFFTGTIADSGAFFRPVVIEVNGITFGFAAYTQTVNILRGKRSGLISVFDSSRVKRELDYLRKKVDFLIVSYHGGDEYKDVPGKSAEEQIQFLAQCDVDIVAGHHSHVPQGIRILRRSVVFNSLGNTVFYQPQKYWTQRSFAALIQFEKRNRWKKISSIEVIPFRAGFQPQTDLNDVEKKKLIDHIQELSTITIIQTERGTFVEPSDFPLFQ